MLSYNNISGYSNWLMEIADTQYPNGALRVVMPNPSGWDWDGSKYPDPDWESAYEFIAWNAYRYYGDGQLLRTHYAGIKRYLHYVMSFAPNGILPEHAGIGDWASAAKHVPSISFTSTCILYHDLRLMVRIARVLHHGKDATAFRSQAVFIRHAFNKRYYKGGGVFGNGGQTAQAMAIYYRLVHRSQLRGTMRLLVKDVHQHQDHLSVGILGDKCLFRALSRCGYTSLAYKIATQTTYPSYGQWILHGATMLWEGWGLYPASMNHIMFGDVVGWMYNDLAGIKPDRRSPGFNTIIIRPRPVKALPWAMAEHESSYGLIKSGWRWHGSALVLHVQVPSASTAWIRLPHSAHAAIMCNGNPLSSKITDILQIRDSGVKEGGRPDVMLHVGPGRYRIRYVPNR
jgi:alpha-L-rhamnosidase